MENMFNKSEGHIRFIEVKEKKKAIRPGDKKQWKKMWKVKSFLLSPNTLEEKKRQK